MYRLEVLPCLSNLTIKSFEMKSNGYNCINKSKNHTF